MAKKNEEKRSSLRLKEETSQTILGLVFFAIAVFFLLASADKAGPVGKAIYELFAFLLGIGYFLIPLLFILLGFSSIKKATGHFVLSRILGSLFFFFAGLGVLDLLAPFRAGIVGKIVSTPFLTFFDFYASVFLLFVVIIISLLVILDTPLQWSWFVSLFKKREVQEKEVKVSVLGLTKKDEMRMKLAKEVPNDDDAEKVYKIEKPGDTPPLSRKVKEEMDAPHKSYISMRPFTPPPLSLLEEDKGKPGVGDIKANANIIKRTLQNFGITVEMDEISIGPSVTRYSLKPAEGVKLSKIVALQNDLALSLAAKSIRIEAPIPGQSLVGIEIPNRDKTTVGLGTILGTEEFQSSEKALLVGLGKSVSGKAHFGNIAKMPHLLLAGSTGSGKSVAIHALITSLLYRNSPESLRFIMIDPKRVELTLYNKIPHLLTPVITEAKKAILSLKWAAKEMDRRYDILEAESVRDIESYHKNILAPAQKKMLEAHKGETAPVESGQLPETMPYIVIVLDELADIMTTYPRELEASIVRLAQMSRAVGIHLILSTQRPSVDVITGLIKANIPARVALQVSSQIDSRTILDTGGAEKLLGAGDLLYLSGEMSKPLRLQSPFISESEVKNVVKFIVDQYKDELPNEINLSPEALEKNVAFSSNLEDGENPADEDPLYEEAREIVLKAGKASTSYLQRKLRVGYARAARLIDMLEENGVIGAGSGAKAREVMGGDASDAGEEIGEDDTSEEATPKELL
ncbi:MAG: DNA translocase FtsK [Candidatus Pacebacteria bacterium]|nr:DNA translocase FtsK [Candidatus Paceibacterota bacterium]MDD5356957.1 DNA translocase FtsK [Candidatus Paceibacterota bacterium]